MAKMKVFVADSIAPEGIAEFGRFPEVELVVKTGLAPAELAAALGDAVGLVVRSATQASRQVIEAGTALKVIGRAGAGVDNIDVKAASERRILVTNTPGGNAEAAAELAVGLMFALAREIPRADASMKAGSWDKKSFSGLELLGKTLGLVGIGNVGGAVARMARGLGMAVVAFDPYARPEKAASLGVLLATLDEVLASADFLSVHAPKNDGTRNLLDAKAFAKMKTGVFVVNCARGGIVVEKDLLTALEAGKVRGAGVDVFEKEPPADWTLARHPKVIATPHLGAATGEAQVNVSVMIARQVGAYLTRGEVLNAVNAVS
jgi:D-3-phosphoglycerate dehydrogenase